MCFLMFVLQICTVATVKSPDPNIIRLKIPHLMAFICFTSNMYWPSFCKVLLASNRCFCKNLTCVLCVRWNLPAVQGLVWTEDSLKTACKILNLI